MPRRPCLDCGALCAGTRCPAHTKAKERVRSRGRDQVRGTKQQRGYDRAYELARARALADATHCGRCGAAFTVDNPATGGHVKAIRYGGTAADGVKAECRRCNYGWERTGS